MARRKSLSKVHLDTLRCTLREFNGEVTPKGEARPEQRLADLMLCSGNTILKRLYPLEQHGLMQRTATGAFLVTLEGREFAATGRNEAYTPTASRRGNERNHRPRAARLHTIGSLPGAMTFRGPAPMRRVA